jgi:hypothetical protein
MDKMTHVINLYVRNHYQILIQTKEKEKKQNLKKEFDTWCLQILEWFHPIPKLPAEWLLLRSEDQDTRE